MSVTLEERQAILDDLAHGHEERPAAALVLPAGFLAEAGRDQAVIRTPLGQDIYPKPHVQAFATALLRATGEDSFGTYLGHSPTPERAIDAFVPVNSSVLGNAMCAFALVNWDRFGLRYMIYRQRIHWGPGEDWEPMADRGSPTQNHMDHGHFAHEETAEGPDPEPQGDPHVLTFRYIFNGVDWVFDGPSRLFFQCDDTRQITEVLDKLEVPALGKVSETTHKRYAALAAVARFTG